MRRQAEHGNKTPQEYVNMSGTPSTLFPVLHCLPFATLAIGTHFYTNYTHQYSETNVMHILFIWLRIKTLYIFRALLAHLQEALHKQYLVYCVRVMSVGCTRIGGNCSQLTTRTQYTKCRLCNTSWGWASDAWNTYRALILNKMNKKCIMLV
jgi:hypothetical protein